MRDVRMYIDQNETNAALIENEDIETLSLDDIIESKIEEGVRAVELSAPLRMLDTGYNFANSVTFKEDYSGYTILPDDFMRFVVFKMSDWKKAVYEAIDTTDPKYQYQSSTQRGIKGNPEKPVCAIVPYPQGLALEFYSCRSASATVEKAVYMKLPKLEYPVDGDGNPVETSDKAIEISERCYRAAINKIASLVLFTYGDKEMAEKFEALAASCLL